MTVTNVRVRRTYRQTVVEFIDVKIVTDGDRAWEAPRLAERLVEAQIAAGQDVMWDEESAIAEKYPAPTLDAEIVDESSEAIPPAPLPTEPPPRTGMPADE